MEAVMGTREIGLLAAFCFGLLALQPNSAWSQSAPQAPTQLDASPIGKVLVVEGAVRIEHPAAIVVTADLPANGSQRAKVGDLVYRGDIIQTGPDGKLGVGFTDGSSFNVSANARMELNEFVCDPHGHSNASLMSLTKGTFTFIAGEVAHTGNMNVKTPVGTMGIRGTAPRVEILNDGSVKFSTLIEQK
jgi:hypothetical protein